MPEISRFLGIVIRMYFNDHRPPHFHVEYNEFEASVVIETLGIVEGRLPAKVLSLAVEWASLHQTELMQNWESIRTTGVYRRIEPLA
ncbi:MAG TPA: DUF4160 domain-containing protein [Blastocatellia bacterium]|nr:DUF4160 domain-containing protein [Blastocatellia bacterium]